MDQVYIVGVKPNSKPVLFVTDCSEQAAIENKIFELQVSGYTVYEETSYSNMIELHPLPFTFERIKYALDNRKSVYWTNSRYIVLSDNDMSNGFGVLDIYNQYYTGLTDSDLKDCYMV